MEKSFSGCEIVEIAIQVEKNGMDFYSILSERSKNDSVKGVFKYLAEQEEEHMRDFKGILGPECSYAPKEVYPEEYFAYMNTLAGSYMFTQKDKGREMAGRTQSDKDAVEIGIGTEKDSILLYEGMKKLLPEDDRGLVDRIISEEQKHLDRLQELQKKIS